jgi:hypothetical protein
VSLADLHQRYGDQVQFIAVYLREAHPIDGWWLGGGVLGLLLRLKKTKGATDIYDPKTIDERRQVAARCESELKYGIPTLVDDTDDSVNRAYAAMPTRLYLVGTDGRVVYAGGLGPFGFKPKELKVAIDNLLAAQVPSADLAGQSIG